MRGRRTLTAVCLGIAATSVGAGSTGAAPPSLYKGSAQRLLPTAAEAGYEQIISQAGSNTRASATYQTPGYTPIPTAKVSVRVFKTELAATSSFDAACPGCVPRGTVPGWKLKFRVDTGADQTNTAIAVARCRNLRVDTAITPASTSKHGAAGRTISVIDTIFLQAQRLGMSPCQGKGTPPPTTGTYYWSESFAEDMVIAKVKIPYCNVYPNDSQCRLRGPFKVAAAQCRGLDEKPGTFTYSRFTCDIRAGYYGDIRGRIAVWPTGPTSLRWEII